MSARDFPEDDSTDESHPEVDEDSGEGSGDESDHPVEELSEEDQKKERFRDIKTKFDEIQSKIVSGKVDLSNEDQRAQFFDDYKEFFGGKTSLEDDNERTLLHRAIERTEKGEDFSRWKPLIEHLIVKYPDTVKETDRYGYTPLYEAIVKKRQEFVRSICELHPELDKVLKVQSSTEKENCIHAAIHNIIPGELTTKLIQKANEEILCQQDVKGRTPLHVAVDYQYCTTKQLAIVKLIATGSVAALKLRATSDATKTQSKQFNGMSAYLFHIESRILGVAEDKAKAEKARVKADARLEKLKAEKAPTEKAERDAKVAKGVLKALPSKDGILEHDSQAKDGSIGKFGGNDLKPTKLTRGSDSTEALSKIQKNDPGAHFGTTSQVPQRKYRSRTALTSTEPASPSSEALKIGPRTESADQESIHDNFPTSRKPAEANKGRKLSKQSKQSVKATDKGKAKSGKVVKKIEKPSEESAKAIEEFLKLHCLRNLRHDDAVDFLYGQNESKQIYFDLYDQLDEEISEADITGGLSHLKLENVLQYVALPYLRLKTAEKPVKETKKPSRFLLNKPGKSEVPDSHGRGDLGVIFRFLRDTKKVKHIIRVIVNDRREPAHSDEEIVKALGGMKVEIWDWQRFDLCTDTVFLAAPNYVEEFKALVESNGGPKVEPPVPSDFDLDSSTHKTHVNGVDAQLEPVARRHQWLTTIDEFANFLGSVNCKYSLKENVTIALIDDGVDMREKSLHGRIIDGKSFCPRDSQQDLNVSYYVKGGGHGTAMANLICRVCPNAQLYILKLEEYRNGSGKPQITAKSAAKAIWAAVQKKVQIISMSWTLDEKGLREDEITDLNDAIKAAADENIVMFCAGSDEASETDRTYPALSQEKRIFKIGAATANKTMWEWTGKGEVDFIFPGHKVVMEMTDEVALTNGKVLTGSSVATAIAAGYAALLLECVQIAALDYADLQEQRGNVEKDETTVKDEKEQRSLLKNLHERLISTKGVTLADYSALKTHKGMKKLLEISKTDEKFVEVYDLFGTWNKKGKTMSDWEKTEVVASKAALLKLRSK
ncbi:uncharacterized protein BP5553_02466 [Venustampulla echinocandica]|uniref:Peptidase S8/S53 domain-containing protein n=1 Tax=Venustampulla echinocandica TaxID=2656787 RepID=A0A370U3Y1_9HELO|nr:uncharacterized protein BP5553_02466 [Venustampulla echinocandica]RDL42487.1 hypothetical protein BP5553_02466 [Venustampulla echinocandica]